jgi:hypothetical protein
MRNIMSNAIDYLDLYIIDFYKFLPCSLRLEPLFSLVISLLVITLSSLASLSYYIPLCFFYSFSFWTMFKWFSKNESLANFSHSTISKMKCLHGLIYFLSGPLLWWDGYRTSDSVQEHPHRDQHSFTDSLPFPKVNDHTCIYSSPLSIQL